MVTFLFVVHSLRAIALFHHNKEEQSVKYSVKEDETQVKGESKSQGLGKKKTWSATVSGKALISLWGETWTLNLKASQAAAYFHPLPLSGKFIVMDGLEQPRVQQQDLFCDLLTFCACCCWEATREMSWFDSTAAAFNLTAILSEPPHTHTHPHQYIVKGLSCNNYKLISQIYLLYLSQQFFFK